MWIVRKIYSFLLDTLQSILVAFSIFLAIYLFIARPFQVNGDSMYPNFQDGEYVLTNIISLRFHDVGRGDVIVFKAPPDPEKDFIKRVIGLPGDSISLRDGFVYVNSAKLQETKYLSPTVRTYGADFLKDGDTKMVPAGQYLVFGDNRPYSSDSREWGLVPKASIIGKSYFIYWPISKAELIHNPFTGK